MISVLFAQPTLPQLIIIVIIRGKITNIFSLTDTEILPTSSYCILDIEKSYGTAILVSYYILYPIFQIKPFVHGFLLEFDDCFLCRLQTIQMSKGLFLPKIS